MIGRNEGENLVRLAASVGALVDYCAFPVETIYVDAASTDDSVKQVQRFFDRVIELEYDDGLCASAGRHIGTLEAAYPWVFYVDADMQIREEFFAVAKHVIEKDESFTGYIGNYIHHFDNGSTALQDFRGDFLKSEWAAHFGGAVLLRKEDVIRAGNWDAGVFGKEEMNLYARIGNGDRVVRYVDVPMVNHFSPFYSRKQLFLRLLYPEAGQGKVFYGFGQSMRSLLRARKLAAYMRLDSELTLYWLLIFLGLALAAALPFGGILLVAELLLLSVWMGPGVVLRFSCLPIPLLAGWSKYNPDFLPTIKNRISRQ